MEHSCYRCNAAVEEGTPFCPHCRAPQIRVITSDSGSAEKAAEAEAFPPPHPERATYSSGVDWPRRLSAAARAGLAATLILIIPFGIFRFLGMVSAGFLAVLFYRRRAPYASLTSGLGARLGALGGLFGFIIFSIVAALETLLLRNGGELRAALIQAVEQAAARNPDPQVQEMMHYFETPQGMVLMMILGLAVTAIFFILLAVLGGMMGASLLRRKRRV